MQTKLMWNLAMKNIKYSKRRGILIIFTIALSVCLIFTVLTYYNSYSNIQKKEAKEKEGAYHAEYLEISKWQLKKVEKNNAIRRYYTINKAQDIKIVNEKLVSNYINPQVVSFDDFEEVRSFYKGKSSQAEDEIVMEKWVMETLGLELDVNQNINLSLSIKDKDSGVKSQIEQKFRIVGILNDVESMRANNFSYIIFNKEYLNKFSNDITYNVKILLKSNFECKKQIKNFATDIGIREDNIQFNPAYIDAYGIELSDLLGIILMIVLIMFIAAIVIFNVYNIYFIQTMKMYGTFKAIGATDRQLTIFGFCEMTILGTIGNAVGVILGIGASYCVVPFVDRINKGLINMVIDISIITIIISVMAGYFIVFAATLWPQRKISKISVVTAYNYNPINVKKNVYNRKIVKKISIKYLAYIHMSRYKKKVIFTIISITSTYLLFIIASSVLGSINSNNMSNLMIGGDFSIQISDDISRGEEHKDILNKDFFGKIDRIKEVEKYNTIMYDRVVWSPESAKTHIELPEEYQELGIGYDKIDSVLYGYDSEFLEKNKKYLEKGKTDIKKLETGEFVLAVNDGITNVSPGDILHLKKFNGDNFQVEVLGVVSDNITYRGYKASGCDIILHQNLLKSLGLDERIQRIAVTSQEGKEKKLEASLKNVINGIEGTTIVSYTDLNKELEKNKEIVSIVSYAFLSILFLMVIFNLLNSTFTNILSRKRELGILEAIGLTRKQEKVLLQLENMFIIGISSLAGILIGFPMGYAAFLIFKRQANYAVYHFPIIESLLLALILGFLQMGITKRCNNILNKQDIIEKIRYKE